MIRCVRQKALPFSWMIIALIWLVAFNSLSSTAASPDFLIRSWQTEDGLPQHSGTALAQTPDGYLWVGTFNGLVRFNGVEFTRFTIANTPELKSDDINTLYVDSGGQLWIGTMIGLVSFQDGTFKRWAHNPNLNRTDLRSVVQGPNGSIFALSSSGVWKIDGDRISEFKLPGRQTPGRAGVIARNDSGQIWFGLGNQIYEVDGDSLRLICQMPLPVSSFLVQDPWGTYWFRQETNVGTWRPTPLDESSTGHSITPQLPAPGLGIPRAFLQSRSGDRWIGTETGLFFWKSRTPKPERVLGLPSDRIICLLEDKDGHIWCGMDGGGLSLITPKQLMVYGPEAGLTGEDVISVLEDDSGQIWVGTFDKGLSVGHPGHWERFLGNLVEPNDAVVALLQPKDGGVWVGSYGRPLTRILNGQISSVPESRLPSCFALFEDRERRIWAGSQSDGVECFDHGTITRWTATNGLSDNSISCFVEDQAGSIWIGTQNSGLNRLQNGSITQFHAPNGPANDGIRALYIDSNDTLWIGTAGAGLTRYKGGKFTTLSSRQGLYGDVVNQIIEDDNDELWLGSSTGIFAFPRNAAEDVLDGKTRLLHCSVFNRKDGLKTVGSPGGFQPTTMKSRDGRLWFASGGGLVVIDPRNIKMGSAPPPVHIERLLADGLEVHPAVSGRRADGEDTITVPTGAKRLELHYVGINFADPSGVQYKYWLEGYDSDWQEAGTRAVAFFSKVPPGRYMFHVKSASQDGNWLKKGAELNVIIPSFFWQSEWFQGLIVATVGGLLWLIYHSKIKSMREVEQMRIRIARDLHDDVGSNIANIALLSQLSPALVVHHSPESVEYPELKEIHDVAHETADILRDVTWFINPEFDTSDEMIHRLRAVAERMLKERLTSFQVVPPIASRRLSIAVRRNGFLIFKEILHNILKHSQATEVRIECAAEPRIFRLRIKDNGIGFDTAGASEGQGLESIRQRAHQIHGILSISSSSGTGTNITIEIPLARRP